MHPRPPRSHFDVAWERGGRGCISGKNLELEPGKQIVQTWSPVEDDWPKGHISEIEILLSAGPEGTTLSFTHRNLPSDKADTFAEAWYDYYWEPLQEYFDAGTSEIRTSS